MFNNVFLFFENLAVCEIMWKNLVQRGGTQMKIRRMCSACWIPKATNALRVCNTYRFSTATMVAGTGLNVTVYVNCLSFSSSYYGKEIL